MCGANEDAQNGNCVCIPGYAKAMEGAVCEIAAVGAACTGDEGCPASFPYCATDGTDRYCSVQGCSPTSCPSGYACEQGSAATYCGKLPVGLGEACTSDADCTKEAKFCDTMMSHKCVLKDCVTKAITCPGFYGCCDLSMLVPNFSLCFAPEALVGGKCPVGNLVAP
jgi:hypothetical protein